MQQVAQTHTQTSQLRDWNNPSKRGGMDRTGKPRCFRLFYLALHFILNRFFQFFEKASTCKAECLFARLIEATSNLK